TRRTRSHQRAHRYRGSGTRPDRARSRSVGTDRSPARPGTPAPHPLTLRPRRLSQGTSANRRDPARRPEPEPARMSTITPHLRTATTAAVRAGIDADTAHGAVVPPIVLSSNFSFDGYGGKRKYDYTRSGNPTRDLLGDA